MRRVIKIYCCFRKQHHLFHLRDIAPAGGVAGTAELSVALPQSRLGKVKRAWLCSRCSIGSCLMLSLKTPACVTEGRFCCYTLVASLSLTLFWSDVDDFSWQASFAPYLIVQRGPCTSHDDENHNICTSFFHNP